jgi:hypothetical protein
MASRSPTDYTKKAAVGEPSVRYIENKKPPGKLKMSDAQLQYLDKVLGILVGFTTFGASITFGLIVADNKEPTDPSNLPAVQALIAVRWVLFVVGLLMSSLATTILYAYQHISSKKPSELIYKTLKNFIDECSWRVSYGLVTLWIVLLLLPLASALLCLAAVVTMYVRVVGIIALVGFGGGFVGILVFSIWYLGLDAEVWEEDKESRIEDDGTKKLGDDISKTLKEFMEVKLESIRAAESLPINV